MIYFILVSAFAFAIFFKTKRSLHMLQQNLYNENNRYLKWIFKNPKQFLDFDIINIFLSIFGMLLIYDIKNLAYLTIIIKICILIIIGIVWMNIINTDQNKKPLVVTARIKRLIFTITLLHLIPVFFLIYNAYNFKITFIATLILSIMLYLNTIVIYIANIINKPIEKIVYLHYKNKAQAKLKSMPNLKIIGITGSYGKTSSKNILSDILNIKYNALPTPKI